MMNSNLDGMHWDMSSPIVIVTLGALALFGRAQMACQCRDPSRIADKANMKHETECISSNGVPIGTQTQI